MKYRMVILPLDDFELCHEAGLTDEQAEQVVLIAQKTGYSVTRVLNVIEFHREPPKPSVLELDYRPSELQPPNRQEHRARSMHKPTGKPWDKRRGQ